MFEILKFNMDKFIHTFLQNLGLRIESHACKKFNKIKYISNMNKSYIAKQLYPTEEIKDINIQQDLDFSSEENIKYFMEKHVNLFDKLTYLNNAQILTSHLRNINTMILQKIKLRWKYNGNVKKREIKTWNKIVTYNKKLRTNLANKLSGSQGKLLFSSECKRKYVNFSNYKRYKFKKAALGNFKLLYNNTTISNDHRSDNILITDNDKKTSFLRHSLSNIVTNITNKQIEMTEQFLWLHVKDIEYMKRNIQVTLHIAKNSKYNYDTKNQIEYNQVLCHHAILCLIEPSEKGAVLIEDNLPVIVQKYLVHGYKYHFDFQRYFMKDKHII
ncbi:uncharacterized protein LOC105681192 [Bombus impatiens]|uniref:Uncharacterized protein LOC105681192 n=1 Tax=Bombus impatiens TaxID=132113 RepID=A0A6P6FE86_BOMIM|nr:uncharacterized protein LOC105681192 [Bombus impatiens]